MINHSRKEYEKACVYMHNWITLLYSRNPHNIVNQLYINKNYVFQNKFHSLSKKCKSKPRQSEWLLSKSLQAINAGEGVEKRNPFTLLVEMQTSTATLENSVEIPLKTRNRTTIRPSNPTAGHTHQGIQNWKRHMYPNVHRSTVYNSQDMETT